MLLPMRAEAFQPLDALNVVVQKRMSGTLQAAMNAELGKTLVRIEMLKQEIAAGVNPVQTRKQQHDQLAAWYTPRAQRCRELLNRRDEGHAAGAREAHHGGSAHDEACTGQVADTLGRCPGGTTSDRAWTFCRHTRSTRFDRISGLGR